jgi:hypothetical protein
MSYRTNNDNIYGVGITIAAKEHPETQLVINSYYQRIYYCSPVNDPVKKELVYFERELVPPV